MKNDCKIKYAYYDSPVGTLRVSCNDHAVTAVECVSESAEGTPSPISDEAIAELAEYFAGKRRSFDVPIETHGTPFQEKVWATLREIPYGETRSYKDIAIASGNEKACRAVGGANHSNPLIIITPCHRVIGAGGAMVGYGGGMEMKKFLLDLERKNS